MFMQITAITAELISNVTGYDSQDLDEVKSLDLHLKEDGGKIHSIENMHVVPNLVQLNLSYNSISRMNGLECLHHLIELNLAENMISQLECLDGLKQLEKLNVSGNQISRIPSSIANLKKLTHLRIARNKLDVITDLLYMKSLSKLCSLRIDENPIWKLEHCRFYVVFHLSSLEYLDGEEIETPLREKALERYAHDTVSQLEQTLVIKQHQLKKCKRQMQPSPAKQYPNSPLSNKSATKSTSASTSAISANIAELQKLEEDILLLRSQIQDFYKKSMKPLRRSVSPPLNIDGITAPLKSSRFASPKNLSFSDSGGNSGGKIVTAERLSVNSNNDLIQPITSVGNEFFPVLSPQHLAQDAPTTPTSSSYQTPNYDLITPPAINSLYKEVETLKREKNQYKQSSQKHVQQLENDLAGYQQQLEESLSAMQALDKEYSDLQTTHKQIVDEHKIHLDEISSAFENEIKDLEEAFQYAQTQWDKERSSLINQYEESLNEKANQILELQKVACERALKIEEKDKELFEHKEVLNKLVQDISTSSSSDNNSNILWSPTDNRANEKQKGHFSTSSGLPLTPIPLNNALNISHPLLENLQYQQHQQQILSLQQELSSIKNQHSQLQSQYDLVSVKHSLLADAQEQWKIKEQNLTDSLVKCEDVVRTKQVEIMQQKLQLQQLQVENSELHQERKSFGKQKEQFLQTIQNLEDDMQAFMKVKQVYTSTSLDHTFVSHKSKNKRRQKKALEKMEQPKAYFDVLSTESDNENGETFSALHPGIVFPQQTPLKSKFDPQNQKAVLSSVFSSANYEKMMLMKKKVSFSPLEKHSAEIVAHVMIEEVLQASAVLRGSSRNAMHGENSVPETNMSELVLWSPSTMRECCLRAAIRLVHFSNTVVQEVDSVSKENTETHNSSSSDDGILESHPPAIEKVKSSAVTPFRLLGDRKYLSHLVAEMQTGLMTIEDSNAYKLEIQQFQKIIQELERKAEHFGNSIGEKENIVKILELHAEEAKKQALDTLNELNEYHQKLQGLRNDYAKIEQEQLLQRQQYELQQKQLSELINQKQVKQSEIQQKQEMYISLQQSETQLKQSLFSLQQKVAHEEQLFKQQKYKANEEIQELINQITQSKLLSQKQEELFFQNKKYSVQFEEELSSKSHQMKQHLQSINSEKQDLLLQITSLKQEISQLKVSRDRLIQEQQLNQSSVLNLQDSIRSLQQDHDNRKGDISKLEETKRKLEEKMERFQQEVREEKRHCSDLKLQLVREIENYNIKKQEAQMQYEQLLMKHQQQIQEQTDLRTNLEQQVKSLSQEQQEMSFQSQSLQYEISQLTKKTEECTSQIQSQERNKLHFANQKHLLEKQISQQQKHLQQLRSEITDHQVTSQQQKSQISMHEHEISNKQQIISQVETNITQLQTVEQRLSNSIKDYYRQTDELLHQINQNKHQLQCEEILVKEKQNMNSQLQEEIQTNEKKKKVVQDEMKQILVCYNDLGRKLSNYEQECSVVAEVVDQKNLELQSIHQQKLSVEEENAALTRNIAKYQQQLSNLQEELQNTKQSLHHSKQQMQSQANQFTTIQEEYNALLERLHEHQAQQQVLLSQQSSLVHENKVLDQQKQAILQQLKISEKQLQSLLEQVNHKENCLISTEHSLKLLESSKVELSKSIQLEQLNLDKLQDSKEKAEEQLWKLHNEIRVQQDRFSSLQLQQQQDVLTWQQQKQHKQHQLLVLADSQKRLAEKMHSPAANNLALMDGKLPYHTSVSNSVGVPSSSSGSRNIVRSPATQVANQPFSSSNNDGKYQVEQSQRTNTDGLGDETNSIGSQDDNNSALTSGSHDVVLYSTLQHAVQSLRQQSAAALINSSTNPVKIL